VSHLQPRGSPCPGGYVLLGDDWHCRLLSCPALRPLCAGCLLAVALLHAEGQAASPLLAAVIMHMSPAADERPCPPGGPHPQRTPAVPPPTPLHPLLIRLQLQLVQGRDNLCAQ